MKRKALVLLVSMVIPVITMACCCCDGYSSVARLPIVERAYTTPVKEWDLEATTPVVGLKTGDGGVDAGFLWSPYVYGRTGISDRTDISVGTDFRPGLTAFGKYELSTNNNAMAAGLKLSFDGFSLPRDFPNPTGTSNRIHRSEFELSPRYMIDSKPGPFEWTFNAGPGYEYSKESYGQGSELPSTHGSSLQIGAEFDWRPEPLWFNGLSVNTYIDANWRAWTNDAYTKTYVPPISFAIGVAAEIAHKGSK